MSRVVNVSEMMHPTDVQRVAFKVSREHRFLLYGGAAGGGKSYWLRWWCVIQLLTLWAESFTWRFTEGPDLGRLQYPHGCREIKVALFSSTYGSLIDRQISKIGMEFPAWLGDLKNTKENGLRFKLNEKLGGGMILFRNLDDPSKYKSAEFAAIAIEELTENSLEDFENLRSRLRWPGLLNPRLVAASNPNGPGHGWVKRYWISRDFPSRFLRKGKNGRSLAEEFAYVPAKAIHNPHISQQYIDDLAGLDDKLRAALLDGSWDIFEGQYFSEWRENVHVCEPFEIPWHWRIERCGDWGEAKPCAYLWVATSPEGHRYVIGEVYGAGMSVEKQAAEIRAFEAGKNVLPIGVLDAACWDTTGRAMSIAEQFMDAGVKWVAAAKGPGSRIAGWRMVRKALQYESDGAGGAIKPPNLRVFKTCSNLTRTMPTMVHDKHKVEDLDSDGEDHAADALRYHFAGPIQVPQTPADAMSEEEAAMLAWARKQARNA